VSDTSLSPSDAIKILGQTIGVEGVKIVPAYVARDLANVRRARPNDVDFTAAVLAIAREIRSAQTAPAQFGAAVEHELEGWRRSKFSAKVTEKADLRLVFRPARPTGIEILAFGDRDFPETVYHTAKSRL
jgi:murein DD-endopeptidase MepM/ murein hydrolase activator NlpD